MNNRMGIDMMNSKTIERNNYINSKFPELNSGFITPKKPLVNEIRKTLLDGKPLYKVKSETCIRNPYVIVCIKNK